jgi:hypothetical protein
VHYLVCCTLQDGQTSWDKIKKWDLVLQGKALDDNVFSVLRPTIAEDICANFHEEEINGSTRVLQAAEFEHYNFGDMHDLFVGIQRRATSGVIKEGTLANRAKVLKEFMRVSWPKGKPPELSPW